MPFSGLRLMLGGDVMLGRLVAEHVQGLGPGYPLGLVAPHLRRADVTLVNLECALTSHRRPWTGPRKPFYFGAPPKAVESLTGAGVSAVSLANNHALDFGREGLQEMVELLDRHGVAHVGAGSSSAEARRPAVLDRAGARLGIVAYCDHQPDFAATPSRAGTAFLDLRNRVASRRQLRDDLDELRRLEVEVPIVSLHWGPNMVDRPSPRFVEFAHGLVDDGWALVHGHSAHVFQGVEVYRGRPIVYAAGDLVDDYQVDPKLRNDLGLLFEVVLDANGLQRLGLHPLRIDRCRVAPADGEDWERAAELAVARFRHTGTSLRRDEARLWVEPDGRPA